ncbi:hypothetical protein KY290_031247 [Solanum tuberosum]|uniref:Uncharacterized protein n=1 Tax=Solanum tuberosum TaxID=4113 RepID=A0ABQ7UAG7_SOLTU|nr:hypothetical protein KY290_031247 [Solanum tuberosum]
MALVLRYVNKEGEVIERFVVRGVAHIRGCAYWARIKSRTWASAARIDQDIVNAMGFLALTKQRLQNMRDNEFESLMDDVSSFCDKHDIVIPEMDASYFPGKSKRKALDVTYSHHLRVEIFYAAIDLHLQELNNRFDAVSTDLLLGMATVPLILGAVLATGGLVGA